jgi:hypothetical protein
MTIIGPNKQLGEALRRRQAAWDFENKDHPLAIKRHDNYLSCPNDPMSKNDVSGGWTRGRGGEKG